MTHHSLVCAVGADRTGLVREVTDTVLSCGCNITESRMATLGSEGLFARRMPDESERRGGGEQRKKNLKS